MLLILRVESGPFGGKPIHDWGVNCVVAVRTHITPALVVSHDQHYVWFPGALLRQSASVCRNNYFQKQRRRKQREGKSESH